MEFQCLGARRHKSKIQNYQTAGPQCILEPLASLLAKVWICLQRYNRIPSAQILCCIITDMPAEIKNIVHIKLCVRKFLVHYFKPPLSYYLNDMANCGKKIFCCHVRLWVTFLQYGVKFSCAGLFDIIQY